MNITEIQSRLAIFGLLEPPSDGQLGAQTQAAIKHYQSLVGVSEPVESTTGQFAAQLTAQKLATLKDPHPLRLGEDWASRIVKHMVSLGYFVARGERLYNIVYVEGVNADGTLNDDAHNYFNDRSLIIEIVGGKPIIRFNAPATTEPGRFYTQNPMNPSGAFRIAFGQYKAWKIGLHGTGNGKHEALVQVGEIRGYRDLNKDGIRTGDAVVAGSGFGVNQHHGYNLQMVEKASAGCLVRKSTADHAIFMDYCKKDRRYLANISYVYRTTIIDGSKL